ncbi:hypothetical protein AJ80_05784 [Polytolypa hystricis UAMH7299]|uniref:NADP-dependent oxidoreductase domain-containing protein n=1 Tax=Polytolypa hystricis (strain UAMH7299) TaxID=1447883 RepID=A0A2B7Y224_POLH7|nr:hypothetical protein AJ80_05784 [Polytolypa hystricis UAMH7299]
MASGLPALVQASVDGTKVEYKQLGKSGLRVSVPIFGAMSVGSPEWGSWILDEEKSLPLLKAAYDKGLNTWDTANLYSNGNSERIIGKTIKKYNIPRHKVLILTKCWGPVSEHENCYIVQHGDGLRKSKDYVNQFGLSRQAIFNAVNDSLKRLDMDYIDLFQIHRYDPFTPIEETMEALHDLVKSGKVRYIGASSMWTYQFAQMQFCAEKNGWTKFVSMQNNYSLLYREEEREMIKFCNDTGVGLIPFAPLNAGFLARPVTHKGDTTRASQNAATNNLTEQDIGIINRVEEIAKKKGWTMSQVSLAWINKRVSSPIVGFSSAERIDDVVARRGELLTEEEDKYLEELYIPKPAYQ